MWRTSFNFATYYSIGRNEYVHFWLQMWPSSENLEERKHVSDPLHRLRKLAFRKPKDEFIVIYSTAKFDSSQLKQQRPRTTDPQLHSYTWSPSLNTFIWLNTFYYQLMHISLKNAELLKHSKLDKNAPTCFGLHRNHL